MQATIATFGVCTREDLLGTTVAASLASKLPVPVPYRYWYLAAHTLFPHHRVVRAANAAATVVGADAVGFDLLFVRPAVSVQSWTPSSWYAGAPSSICRAGGTGAIAIHKRCGLHHHRHALALFKWSPRCRDRDASRPGTPPSWAQAAPTDTWCSSRGSGTTGSRRHVGGGTVGPGAASHCWRRLPKPAKINAAVGGLHSDVAAATPTQ